VPLDWLIDQILQNGEIPPKVACITFDDGYKDNYVFAFPILKKYDIPATIFLTTGYVGGLWPHLEARFSIWNTRIPKFDIEGLGCHLLDSSENRISAMNSVELQLDNLPWKEKTQALETLIDVLDVDFPNEIRNAYSFTWEEVAEMAENSISFGSHTVTHTNLTKLPIDEAREEIIQSKEQIERAIGVPCTLFAYPNGKCNSKIISLLKEHAFKGAVVTSTPNIFNRENLFSIYRIPGKDTFYQFKAYDSGLYIDLLRIMNFLRISQG